MNSRNGGWNVLLAKKNEAIINLILMVILFWFNLEFKMTNYLMKKFIFSMSFFLIWYFFLDECSEEILESLEEELEKCKEIFKNGETIFVRLHKRQTVSYIYCLRLVNFSLVLIYSFYKIPCKINSFYHYLLLFFVKFWFCFLSFIRQIQFFFSFGIDL